MEYTIQFGRRMMNYRDNLGYSVAMHVETVVEAGHNVLLETKLMNT